MYHVEISNNEGYIFNVRANESTFTIDAKGKGITPPDTLLASIGSCIGVYLRKYTEGTKIPLNNVNISVSADFTKERPVRFQDINVKISINDSNLGETQKNALLAFIRNCPVHNTLKNNPNVEISIV
jgi:uncharacterized OsmC-like protein